MSTLSNIINTPIFEAVDIHDALVIYTDGSRLNSGRAESGIYIRNTDIDNRCSLGIHDYCFVSRAELIVISKAFEFALLFVEKK